MLSNRAFIDRYIKDVAYRVGGYDLNCESSQKMLEGLILAGRQYLKICGVSESVLDCHEYSHLVLASLVIYVNDNLNLESGETKLSEMFIRNADSLRSRLSDQYEN